MIPFFQIRHDSPSLKRKAERRERRILVGIASFVVVLAAMIVTAIVIWLVFLFGLTW